ncbi:dolichyl-P-Glc:Man9GlcNAc2-PP-dolichol alpha-1,3-glucosyltransferase [Malassezia nana]|uniref:dolichyl-P-Glc:Man9GlcNAc2-PP-dolichol alpha-1,3-glucosyltransferase n=1 Tax=Malassezia nana TaxID=180528 RepID=A0AAF0EL11_9BASI|nr:dolichyl-P-Glc:Man9GlcNAc2-PP-dolichol alpha-1,3-glucosyltransferase [Malassezia nana]
MKRDGRAGAPGPAAGDNELLDVDRSADIPLGYTRARRRTARPMPSQSSLGSGRGPPASASSHARQKVSAPLSPPLFEEGGTSRVRSSQAPQAMPRAPRALSEAQGPTSRGPERDTGSLSRTRVPSTDKEEQLGRAMSSSSRVLWTGSASARAEAASDTYTHDRIALWREQSAREAHSHEPKRTILSSKEMAQRARTPADLTDAETPLRTLLRYLAQEELSHSVYLLGFLAAVLLRSAVALGSWSGRASPPMFGDFEAQRHWMELTWHLPVRRWYRYDLPYWGLDYPPLTAWVSYLCAFVASFFPALQPALALRSSRGTETPALVLFMRWSVLVFDMLVYLPAVAWFVLRRLEARSTRVRHIALWTVWCQPALILIDHGHFQYNGVMLGLAALSFALLLTKLPNVHTSADAQATAALQRLLLDTLSRHVSLQYVAAAVFFSLSLCFKQMSLYYAPAVFSIMLGRCVGLARTEPARGAALFAGLAAVTTVVFAVLWLPWLGQVSELGQVLHRVFPLARGLFEDKVANVWCALTVLPVGARWKLPNLFGIATLAKMSTVAVLLAILPCCVLLFMASVETVRRESIADDTHADQVVADLRRRAGSVVSGTTRRTARGAPSGAASAHESSRGSDRRSMRSGSALAGHTSMLLPGGTRRSGTAASTARRTSATALPAAELLPYTLASTSLAFYLWGFQTHEKSVLLPLLPLTLLLTVQGDRTGAGAAAADWEWGVFANNVGLFSLYPLLQRDGQALAWAVLLVLWNYMIGYRPWAALHARAPSGATLRVGAQAAMLALLLLQASVPVVPHVWAPLLRRYPDLFPVLTVLLCMPALLLVWLWTLSKHLQIALATGLLSVHHGRPDKT